MRALLFVPLVVLPVTAAPLPPVAQDMKAMQGTWTVVSFERDRGKMPEEEIKQMTFVIKDDTLHVSNGKRDETGTLKLDASKTPKTLDLLMKKGVQSETVPFIYELDGDTLKLCWNEPGKDRPTAFDATKATGLIVLKRKK